MVSAGRTASRASTASNLSARRMPKFSPGFMSLSASFSFKSLDKPFSKATIFPSDIFPCCVNKEAVIKPRFAGRSVLPAGLVTSLLPVALFNSPNTTTPPGLGRHLTKKAWPDSINGAATPAGYKTEAGLPVGGTPTVGTYPATPVMVWYPP